jgi:hypothetical protein
MPGIFDGFSAGFELNLAAVTGLLPRMCEILR